MACQQAVRSIAPSWPLDGAVAINPHWHRIHMPVRQVAARLVLLGGINVLPQQAYLRDCWNQGRITRADLEVARAQSAIDDLPDAQALVAALYEPPVTAMPLVVDELVGRVGGRLRLLCASDLQMPAALAAGFDGLSSTNSCALPELIHDSFHAYRSGDARRGAALYRSWYAYRVLARNFGQPQSVKAAMRLRGWVGGHVRAPLLDLTAAQMTALEAVVKPLLAERQDRERSVDRAA